MWLLADMTPASSVQEALKLTGQNRKPWQHRFRCVPSLEGRGEEPAQLLTAGVQRGRRWRPSCSAMGLPIACEQHWEGGLANRFTQTLNRMTRVS